MAHTVVITSVSHIGDTATAIGTVDGQPVTVTFWWSAIQQMATAVLAQQFIAGLMAAQLTPIGVTIGLYNGTLNV